MASEKSSANFISLDEVEKSKKLTKLAQINGEIKLWKKGAALKEIYQVISFDKITKNILLRPLFTGQSQFTDVDILINFHIKEGQYFATGKMGVLEETEIYKVNLHDPFYKYERRKNLRVLSYSVEDIKVLVPTDQTYQKDKNGLIFDFPNKKSEEEKKLFNDFLQIMDKSSTSTLSQDVQIFSAADFSSTGISFYITDLEIPYFQKGVTLSSFFIRFNNNFYEIPQGFVVYISEYKDSKRPKTNLYKVAVEYKNLPEDVKVKLVSHINQEIKHIDSKFAFEEFIG